MFKLYNELSDVVYEKKFTMRDEVDDYINENHMEYEKKYLHIIDSSKLNTTIKYITEGLNRNDMAGLLFPKISFDEYVPRNKNSDNIVIGLYLSDVQGLVYAVYKMFYDMSFITDSSYSESFVFPKANVIYLELQRNIFHIDMMKKIMKVLMNLSDMDITDFVLGVPNKETTQFDYDIISDYLYNHSSNQIIQMNKEAIKTYQSSH